MEEKLLFEDTFIICLIGERKTFWFAKSFNHIGKKFNVLQNFHHTSVAAGHLITCGRDFLKHKHATLFHK